MSKVKIRKPNKKTDKWSAKMFQTKWIAKLINPNPEYQRPETDELVYGGTGSDWQRGLVSDVLQLHPFQKIHLRQISKGNKLVWEIVDGGHRSRAIMGFFSDCVKTIEGLIIFDEDGNQYDIGDMFWSEITTTYPELETTLLEQVEFDLTIHENITDKDAEKLFLTLNDLHDMSPADKRNAIKCYIAEYCRTYGAVDSKKAISIFRDKEYGKDGKKKLVHCGLALTKRETDEIISMCVQYMYEGGIFSPKCKGLDSQKPLDLLYNSQEFNEWLAEKDGEKFLENVLNIIQHMDGVVRVGRLDSLKGTWKKGGLKKLFCLLYEISLTDKRKFKSVKINYNLFHSKLNETIRKNTKLSHHPHQRYELINGVVVKSKNCEPNKSQTFGFTNVFAGGARVDDLEFVLLNILKTYVPEEWGVNVSMRSEDVRDFSSDQKNILWEEQNGKCKKCKCDLNESDIEKRADHIVPHKLNGPTIIENGQLLCYDCNEQKSSGMDIEDVIYVCNKMKYNKVDSLIDMIDSNTLTIDEIKLVSKKLFK
jgi:hypothetical protein